MNNYNGRQITQMRFKDVRELERFRFVSGDYDLQVERLEDVSQDKTWQRLIEILMETYNRPINIPLILYDDTNENMYCGYVEGVSYSGYSNQGNSSLIVEIIYDPKTDALQIQYTEEDLMSADNVKTLFGTESIIGSGNIDLFTHFLTLTAADGSVLYINFPSSNKLECDSLQDLTTMTKATKTSGTKIGFGSTYIIYDSTGIWKTANNTAITKVEDKVFTI